MYSIFLIGGIVASFPSILHDLHMKREESDIKRIFRMDSIFLPSFVSRGLQDGLSFFAKKLLRLPRKACGSSGSVCALLGAYIVITLKDCYEAIYRTYKSLRNHPSSTPINRNLSYTVANSYKLMIGVTNLSRAFSYIFSELNYAYASRVVSRSSPRFMSFVTLFQDASVRSLKT